MNSHLPNHLAFSTRNFFFFFSRVRGAGAWVRFLGKFCGVGLNSWEGGRWGCQTNWLNRLKRWKNSWGSANSMEWTPLVNQGFNWVLILEKGEAKFLFLKRIYLNILMRFLCFMSWQRPTSIHHKCLGSLKLIWW